MRIQIMNKKYSLWFLFLALVAVGCNTNSGKESKLEVKRQQQYRCPMHHEVVRDKPGTCPICGMELVAFGGEERVVTGVSLNTLLRPTNSYVLSSVAITSIQQKEEPVKIEALGTVQYDTRGMGAVSARVSGRIEKLYLKYTFQDVSKGQKIMDIYSPELLTAQQNLLFLVNNDPENTSFIQAAKEKLLLLGMSSEQLQKVVQSRKPSYTVSVYSSYSGHIHDAFNANMNASSSEPPSMSHGESPITRELMLKEGMYVQKGQTVLSVMNPHQMWAVLNIYGSDQSLVKKGNPVRIVPESDTTEHFMAKIDFIEPFFREGSKTLAARVYFENHSMDIPVGSQVKATISGNTLLANWLPKDAVVSLGINKVVFKNDGGVFKAHKVETGLVYQNTIQILTGLGPDDVVAANAQFLMDSESFIKINE
ncbi:MAG TPA: efflux RND transporter periplasmic adaptor subunit [Puia sp.]|nr:efflux RND transporter periplasmic adaptor subunit [Puia sp.]